MRISSSCILRTFLLAPFVALTLTWSLKAGASRTFGFQSFVALKAATGVSGGLASEVSFQKIENRNMASIGAELGIGANVSFLFLGMGLDWSSFGQVTKSEEVSGTNMSASGAIYGPLLGLSFGAFQLVGKLPIGGTYDLKAADAWNRKLSMNQPKGYSAQLRFILSQGAFIGFDFSDLKFSKYIRAGVETPLASGSEISFQTFGVISGYQF